MQRYSQGKSTQRYSSSVPPTYSIHSIAIPRSIPPFTQGIRQRYNPRRGPGGDPYAGQAGFPMTSRRNHPHAWRAFPRNCPRSAPCISYEDIWVHKFMHGTIIINIYIYHIYAYTYAQQEDTYIY